MELKLAASEHSALLGLMMDGTRFQPLVPADRVSYGQPDIVFLNPPPGCDEAARRKYHQWISWRGAPYPATRHSEYLGLLPEDLTGSGPRILVSATLRFGGVDLYLANLNNRHRGSSERDRLTGRKAAQLGYRVRPIYPKNHAAAIHAIVHSTTSRQGRKVAERLIGRPADYGFPLYEHTVDPSYRDICVGAFTRENELVAYCLGRRVGEHVQFDEIMGHVEHLRNGVMSLLHFGFLQHCGRQDTIPRYLTYRPWYSGANAFSPDGGLNVWKRRLLYRPTYLICVR